LPDVKAGLRVPELNDNPDKAALVDNAVFVMVNVYVLVLPSWAVTMAVMVLLPVLIVMGADAFPLLMMVPFTVTLAVTSANVGVTVIDAVPIDTPAAYVIVAGAKAGVRVPLLMVRLLRSAFDDAALVTVMV